VQFCRGGDCFYQPLYDSQSRGYRKYAEKSRIEVPALATVMHVRVFA
jgi:hypothetical protein